MLRVGQKRCLQLCHHFDPLTTFAAPERMFPQSHLENQLFLCVSGKPGQTLKGTPTKA